MLATPGAEFFNIYEAVIQKAVEGFVSSALSVVVVFGAVLLGGGLYLRRRLARVHRLG
jgi:hypothetical protein